MKRKPIISSISEHRILQLANDAAENICSGSVEEWRAVAAYFQNAYHDIVRRQDDVESSIAIMTIGEKMKTEAFEELNQFHQAYLAECKRQKDTKVTARSIRSRPGTGRTGKTRTNHQDS